MGNQVDNKFTWLIKDYCTWLPNSYRSDQFVIGGCKWQILAYPKGKNGNQWFYLDLELLDIGSFPSQWKRAVKFSFTVVNYFSKKLSKEIGLTHWFHKKERSKGISMLPLSQLTDKQSGFLVDGEVEIVVRINVHETDPLFDRSKADEVATTLVRIVKPNDDGAMSSKTDLVYVNGFQVLPSQVGFVRRIFGKHPDTAVECCTKNQDLRTSYINVLFTLIKMLYKKTQDQSTDDLSDAEAALAYMKSVGFKLNWLEKKLVEVKENKKRHDRVTELEQQLQDLMNKYTSVGQQLEKERAEIKKATSLDISFNDVV
ncbi:PREDICTED: MATH domain and coiled-coil domain-containing protein At3g58240-like [Camelina sativa]|uniref:MATH domain and coiled-coil domain-containing protein At3g58240-like n=1 Tax=Camelina sativa TaxID=90675 RepID=A0ABM0TKH7_CAMSA|nr:PREDICTED: MATH domain and coiled-coil domain-containing protein At3g58240-like [Camelina sativa]